MKERFLEIVRRAVDPASATNEGREYLEARILLALQEVGAMIPLAFQGGTALRFLFDLPRFSEDLDFALERPERNPFDLASSGERIVRQLRREGYDVESRVRTDRVAQSIRVGFAGLLHEAGLSPHPSQRLNIRVEVDTAPPEGAGLATTVVRRHVLLNLQHHDRPSLLAGKLHAVLQRDWAKGRDLFDLFWYLADPRWPPPNLTLLNNALAQTEWEGPELDGSNWRSEVRRRVAALDWEAAERDVEPFLEPGPETDAFGRETLLGLLE